MINLMLVEIVRNRSALPRENAGTERLRRAGYADGERRPRRPRHWANR